jgi:lipopolysaccharide export LptBFGC system permease protein LptF
MVSLTLLRYLLAGYLTRTTIVMLTLLAVALTVDLAKYQDQVLSAGDLENSLDRVRQLVWYCGLRSFDIVTRMLGIATFLGVLWWEFSLNGSRERVAIWNAGVTRLGELVPALVFALVLTGVQASLEFWLRPATVQIQIEAGLGAYGTRYGGSDADRTVWFMAGDDLVAAKIDKEPPASLRDLIVYRLTDGNRLRGVVTARSATPTDRADIWTFTSVRHWEASGPSGRLVAGPARARMEGPLETDPLWLEFRHVPAMYLPQADLVRLVERKSVGVAPGDYATWEQARYARSLLPALFALVAFTIGVLSCGRPATLVTFMACFASGYLLHNLSRTAILLGEFGIISPFNAAALPVIVTGVLLVLVNLRGTGFSEAVIAAVLPASHPWRRRRSRLKRMRQMSESSESILGQTSRSTRSSIS